MSHRYFSPKGFKQRPDADWLFDTAAAANVLMHRCAFALAANISLVLKLMA